VPPRSAPRVCHVTSVHSPLDARVLYHECRSLATRWATTLVCRDDGGDRTVEGVRIVTLPRARGRLARFAGAHDVVALAERQAADLYHFHDPELLPAMHALATRTGVPVVYDAHEHYPDAMDQKSWIPGALRPLASRMADRAERRHVPALSAVVVADHALEQRFREIHDTVVRLDNYPPLSLFGPPRPMPAGRPTLTYVGALSVVRGFLDMLEVLRLVLEHIPDARLVLHGPMTEDARALAADAMRGLPEGSLVMSGRLPYGEMPAVLREAHVGLSLLRPHPKYEKNVSMKVFDYMAAGVPYVASDFSPLREATGGAGGILTTPGDVQVAASAVLGLLGDPERAAAVGAAGRAAVEGGLNWEAVEPRLFALYERLLGVGGTSAG
jgi:glycosyltransferase involved in cell wall biosynthesis